MTYYKCNDCGHRFDSSEAGVISENRGECWGVTAYEELLCCPNCDSIEVEETNNNCATDEEIDEVRKDFDICYEVSLGETENVKLNALLASFFSAAEIEDILIEHIKTQCPDADFSAFIDSDKEWFGERLKEVI
jgi:hypothetical protein